jgi:hypothetical protein
MIELNHDQLTIHFPEVHEDATLHVDFQRTLRIPDDERLYPLPAGLGRFPLRHVDDYARTVPPHWIEHGGVMLPMYQAEALWIAFHARYPCVVKVAAGKINAVTGEEWRDGLHRDPQDYLTVPEQPWLDGYCVERGVIRQFVAMPLGAGFTAEEQITGRGEVGGFQILVYPMKHEAAARYRSRLEGMRFGMSPSATGALMTLGCTEMGLAPGGRMQQEIFADGSPLEDWDQRQRARCFVHLANAPQWRAITGDAPPTEPITARDYERAGIPWFEFYAADLHAPPLSGAGILARLKSVAHLGRTKGQTPLPENDPIQVERVVKLRRGLKRSEVREGAF